MSVVNKKLTDTILSMSLLTVMAGAAIAPALGVIKAQGGLSVAGGCRCLTKELDMIAC